MTFPSGVPDGYEYTNPDNNKVYRWDDPPGAWTLIGTNDGDGGGGTPNPPGDGLVEGTDLKVQCYKYDQNMLGQYSAEDMAVRVDLAKVPSGSSTEVWGPQFFSYSYDQSTWYPCTETGGAKQGQIPSVHKVVKSNGDTFWYAVEASFTALNRIWKSADGINWSTQAATGLPTSVTRDQWGVVTSSKDTLILLSYRSNNAYGLLSQTYYASTDDGATWTQRSFPVEPVIRSCFVDEDVMIVANKVQGATGNPDYRVSVDGGQTWGAMSGLPTGGSTNFNVGNTLIFASRTDPKTYYVYESTDLTSIRLYYITNSDLQSGTRAWTSVSNVPEFFNLSTAGSTIHTVEYEGTTYALMGYFSQSRGACLVHKMTADNTDVESYGKIILPSISSGTGSNFAVHSAQPYYQSFDQPAKLLPLYQQSAQAPSYEIVMFGIGKDLFYNGIKMQFSPINRLAL